MLIPRQKTPDLILPTLDHGTFDLSKDKSEHGTIICFYRGLHCPLCATYLTEFQKRVADFTARGANTIAISSDGEERTRAMADKIGADTLRFAYDLPLAKAREWGQGSLSPVTDASKVIRPHWPDIHLCTVMNDKNIDFGIAIQ